MVLGLRSYDYVKDHAHAKAVLNLFAMDRTLLFVGCGGTISDPNFTRLIEWAKDALEDVPPRHFLLCRTSEVPKFQAELGNAPWLQPLDYGANYSALAPFLNDSNAKRLVILGDPGSGKSTLLQFLLLTWGEKVGPDLSREPLPLLIELR